MAEALRRQHPPACLPRGTAAAAALLVWPRGLIVGPGAAASFCRTRALSVVTLRQKRAQCAAGGRVRKRCGAARALSL